MGEPLAQPHAMVTALRVGEPASRAIATAAVTASGTGADVAVPDVIVGLIDVGGFDFSHPDFSMRAAIPASFASGIRVRTGRSRMDKPPRPFGYGAELTFERMQRALDWSRTHAIGATDLVRQSMQIPGAHGTHVASIAAGNRGVCPHAAIAGVLIALSADERDRHATLYDSTRLASAVDYLFAVGEQVYGRPVPTVINISLGTNGHAHDGTSPICRWIDAALMTPGRCVCVAAGNAGQEAPGFAGNLGYLTGRIHVCRPGGGSRPRGRPRVAGRRQRHCRRVRERAGDLVRSRRRVRGAPARALGHVESVRSRLAPTSRTGGSTARRSCRSTASVTSPPTAAVSGREPGGRVG